MESIPRQCCRLKKIFNNYDFKLVSRTLLSRTISNKSSLIVLSDDGKTIICSHPETHFPYEHSKPIDKELLLKKPDTVLKVQYYEQREQEDLPWNKGPDREKLRKMFFTTHHQWWPNREKRYLEPRPKDRESL